MTIKRTETYHADTCPSCGDRWEDHLGLARTCAKWQGDKFLLRGALRIIREAGMQVTSEDLLQAAKEAEDEQ